MQIFTKYASVSGQLHSSFVFKDEVARNKWVKFTLPRLEKEHGLLNLSRGDLNGLKVGEMCHVAGEGLDLFKIEEIVKYSEDRYGFLLDAGWSEEVIKCYSTQQTS